MLDPWELLLWMVSSSDFCKKSTPWPWSTCHKKHTMSFRYLLFIGRSSMLQNFYFLIQCLSLFFFRRLCWILTKVSWGSQATFQSFWTSSEEADCHHIMDWHFSRATVYNVKLAYGCCPCIWGKIICDFLGTK